MGMQSFIWGIFSVYGKNHFKLSNAWIEKFSMWALHDDDLVDINSLKVKVK